jgi:twitching motility protein PilJ
LPVLGSKPAAQHQRSLAVLLAVGLVVLGGVTLMALGQTDKVSQQVAASGQALMQSQRLAKSVSQALVGNGPSFDEVRDSSGVLAKTLRALKEGDPSMSIAALPSGNADELEALTPTGDKAEKNATVVLSQQKILMQVGMRCSISRQSSICWKLPKPSRRSNCNKVPPRPSCRRRAS